MSQYRLKIVLLLLMGSTLLCAQNIATLYNAKSYNYLEINIDSMEYWAHKAMKASEMSKDLNEKAIAHIHLGLVYNRRGEYTKSNQHYERADSVSSLLSNENLKARVQMEMADNLSEYSEFALKDAEPIRMRADKMYAEALSTFQSTYDTVNSIKLLVKRGILRRVKGETLVARQDLRKALHYAQQINNRIFTAKALQNLAGTFYATQQYDSMVYWGKLGQTYVLNENIESRAVNALNIGLGYFMLEQDDSALHYYNKAEEISSKRVKDSHTKVLFDNLAVYHYITKNYKKSADYYYEAKKLRDSLESVEKSKLFTITQERFHTKELETEAIEAKRLKQKWYWISISALLLLLIGLITFLFKRKQLKDKITLEQQKFTQKIEQQDNKNLQAILDALEADRERIAQDLHDRIGAGISTAKLYFESLKDMIGDENKKVTDNFTKVENLLTRSIDEVRQVSRNITSSVLADFGLVPALIDLKETIESSGKLQFEFTNSIQNRLDKNIEINVYRSIQELVSNTIKYAECSAIQLSIAQKDAEVQIEYSDNGKGFNIKKQPQGLGHKNIDARINSLNGNYTLTSTVGTGVQYTFTIPL